MARVQSSGVGIEYDDLGTGEVALIGLPGWCIPRTIFRPLVDALAGRIRALAIDWRGHGNSDSARGDFTSDVLVDDAIAVIEASGARRVIPVAQAHASWLALELRRRLGTRIPRIVCLSWLLLDPPPMFRAALGMLQDPARWEAARDALRATWLTGAPERVAETLEAELPRHGFDMWARAGREIEAEYARRGSGLRAAAALIPPVPLLHLYAQPAAPEFLAAQREFAAEHRWFEFQRLQGVTHFPSLELPEATADAILQFAAGEL